jgi:hypothetical protein
MAELTPSCSGDGLAIPLAFVREWAADAIYVTIALMWFVPDRRIESRVRN